MENWKPHAIALVTLLWATSLSAAEVVKETPGGGINWSDGVVYAYGYGTAKPELNPAQRKLLSRRAAIIDGQRNLLEMTKGVRITSEERVSDALDKQRITVTRIEGITKGAVPIKENYQNDIFTVTLAMPMAGQFIREVWQPEAAPQTISLRRDSRFTHLVSDAHAMLAQFQLIPSAYADDLFLLENETEAKTIRRLVEWLGASGNRPLVDRLQQSLIAYEKTSLFSGLLVNASSIPNFELATIPKIRNEDGAIVYPSESTSYDDIVNKRGVSYDFDLEDAIRNKRVAKTPFIIQAKSTYKSLASDLVISNEDAKRIVLSPGTRDAMNKAGVLIVVAM